MKIWTSNPDVAQQAVDAINGRYKGNMRLAGDENVYESRRKPGTYTIERLRIRPVKSRGIGGRRSASAFNNERAVCAACWHAYRDYITALFALGATRVKTVAADYTSPEDFESKYPGTGYDNIGSQFYPVQMNAACACTEDGNYIGRWEPENVEAST